MSNIYDRVDIIEHLKKLLSDESGEILTDSELAELLELTRQSIYQFRGRARNDISTIIMSAYINRVNLLENQITALEKILELYKKESSKFLSQDLLGEIQKKEKRIKSTR